ncbi:hypothetical protein PX52LOC_06641 [Limnoglobus roseus]|uniref:Uncharacterized protein n=1 Tax=Limnoglobus roseus TaxID=2598579 RepID=A0A5C1ALW7_9BACT|nr:hypothetical protein PX52LOC_06641 [Limnoglobus roseus]
MLAGVGVVNSDQVKALQDKRPALEAIRAAGDRDAASVSYAGARKQLATVNASEFFANQPHQSSPKFDDIQTRLAGLGLNQKQAVDVTKRCGEIYDTPGPETNKLFHARLNQDAAGEAEAAEALRASCRRPSASSSFRSSTPATRPSGTRPGTSSAASRHRRR